MTLEKKSKISLKQWVTTIRRYEYELPRLYEKLEYLKVRSIGYSSPSFEPKFGGRGVSNNYSIDYWLERIEACEAQIKKREKEIEHYNKFLDELNELERSVFVAYFYNKIQVRDIAVEYRLKSYQIYTLFKKLKALF